MNVYIVTTDEPFYLPHSLFSLLKRDENRYITGIVVLSPQSKKRGWTGLISEFYQLYGLKDFLITGFNFAWKKLQIKIPKSIFPNRLCSISDAATLGGVQTLFIDNINSASWLADFKKLQPDLIVSLSASRIFKKEIIELPTYGVINVHSAPLPKYRGLMPSFWQLYNGEEKGAVTIHWMEKGIDSGDIILQRWFDITPDETQDSLIRKGKFIGSELVHEAIELIEKYGKDVPTIPNDESEATYYSFPTKEEAKQFKKMGKKFW